MTFVKGRSGHPSGRLRRGLSISDHVKELLDKDHAEFKAIYEYLEGRGEHSLGRVTVARLVACRIIAQALAGQAELTRELLNRVEGKVPDRVDVSEKRSVNIHIQLWNGSSAALPEAVIEGEGVKAEEPKALPA